jgi:hypothetical protein
MAREHPVEGLEDAGAPWSLVAVSCAGGVGIAEASTSLRRKTAGEPIGRVIPAACQSGRTSPKSEHLKVGIATEPPIKGHGALTPVGAMHRPDEVIGKLRATRAVGRHSLAH